MIASTPLEPGEKLSTVDKPANDLGKAGMEAYPYRQVVRKLMYIVVCTKSDIYQVVIELGILNAYLGLKHWESAMRVLRYLSRIIGVGLMYKRGSSKDLWGHVVASHMSCPDVGKGRAAYVFMSDGAPISWASRRY